MNGDVRGDRRGVIVVASLERAEETLLAGDMPCPAGVKGVLRPFGTGRTRTVTLTAAA